MKLNKERWISDCLKGEEEGRRIRGDKNKLKYEILLLILEYQHNDFIL